MISDINALARKYDSYIDSDYGGFRRQARILQSIWRQERGYQAGLHRGVPLGSRLLMPDAQDDLTNYLNDTIRSVVRAEVLDPDKSKGKLYAKPRIFNDLLSSQPLCFNLFSELQQDLELASAVIKDLTNGRAVRVTKIEFEWSPGKGKKKYTNDRSAFDVYVEYRTPKGGNGFIGIEVKYHENLRGYVSNKLDRYLEISAAMGCFRQECFPLFEKSPLHQIWRDHLLAGIYRLADSDKFSDGFFVFLYPKDNNYCTKAVEQYRSCLTNSDTFDTWTLEQVVHSLRRHTSAPWVELFYDRYLDFTKLHTP